jgi:site-specific DNA-methyltransferase (adenine-specific)
MSFRLHTGDAVELMRSLPSASIDLLLTDTAYESLEKHRAVGTTTRLKQSAASSNEWFPIFRNERFPEFFAEAFRVLKKGTHLYFFCDDETAEIAKPIARATGFTFWNTIIWVKTRGAVSAETMEQADVSIGLGYHWRRSHENILMFEKGKRKLNDLGIPDVLPFPRVRGSYPTEKPIDLLKVIVAQSTTSGEIVLDPFMGSGSAGSAAVRLGRSFVGGDIKESAVALARQRLLGAGAKEDPALLPARNPEDEPKRKPTRAAKALAAVILSGFDPTSDQAAQVRAAALGHAYPGSPVGGFEFTSDCVFGCGCWMGDSRSGGPSGVSPFGECPKHDPAFIMPASSEERRKLRDAAKKRCPNEGCQSPACQAMNRCLALEPIPDDDLV